METFMYDGDSAAYMFDRYKQQAQAYLEIEPNGVELWAETTDSGKVRACFVGTFFDNNDFELVTGEIYFNIDSVATNEDQLREAVSCSDKISGAENTLELI